MDFLPGEIRPWRGGYRIPLTSEIREYLNRSRTEFSHQDLQIARIEQLSGKFYRQVLRRTMQIPYGRTMAYSDVADSLGSRAWRATGSALANNPLPILVPCHRVVAKNGLGGFGGQVWLKRRLLELEGAEIP